MLQPSLRPLEMQDVTVHCNQRFGHCIGQKSGNSRRRSLAVLDDARAMIGIIQDVSKHRRLVARSEQVAIVAMMYDAGYATDVC